MYRETCTYLQWISNLRPLFVMAKSGFIIVVVIEENGRSVQY